MSERRWLQAAVAVGCLSPLIFGGLGIVRGPAGFGGAPGVSADLDSHFRYLSGIFFATTFGFASCIPAIERHGKRFRLLAGLVVMGGLARALSLAVAGPPSAPHIVGLAVELGVVPILVLWQSRVARLGTR